MEDIKVILNEMNENIKTMKSGQEEIYEIIRGLEHNSQVHKADIEGLKIQVNKLDEKLNDKIDSAIPQIAKKVAEIIENILDEKIEKLEMETAQNKIDILKLKQRLRA